MSLVFYNGGQFPNISDIAILNYQVTTNVNQEIIVQESKIIISDIDGINGIVHIIDKVREQIIKGGFFFSTSPLAFF